MQQNSSRSIKLSNKFELLQFLQTPDCDSSMNKKKEAELQAYESTLQKWNRAQFAWTEKEKKLEEEKNSLLQPCKQLKASSDQRNNGLQRQIDELKSLFQQQEKSELLNRKKPKKKAPLTSIPPNSLTNPANEVEQMIVDGAVQPTSSDSVPTQSTNKQASPQSPVKPIRPPPIFVYGVTNYVTFSKFLKENKVNDCIRKETNNYLILTTATSDQYRCLHAVLRKECTEQTNKEAIGTLQIHFYQLKCD